MALLVASHFQELFLENTGSETQMAVKLYSAAVALAVLDFTMKTVCMFLQFLHVLQACDYVEREQETAWVCRATGQKSQDKGKETQMEVPGLKLSSIPRPQKTNIHQQRVIKV